MLAIIQARFNSRRFRGKILYPIHDKPIILHVISKVKKAKGIKKVIVATSKNKTDDILVELLKKNRITYFRGELNNVAKRSLNAAKKFNSKYFVRISADSPLIDFRIIDLAINNLKKDKYKNYDIITNTFPRTFPKGQSVEIIKTIILDKYLDKMNKLDLEHITRYFYRNSKKFLIKNFKINSKKSFIKLAVDTKSDLRRIINKIKKDEFKNFSIIK